MDSKAWGSVELLVANVTFEMLGLLMEDKYFFIIKFTIAIPVMTSQGQRRRILFIAHPQTVTQIIDEICKDTSTMVLLSSFSYDPFFSVSLLSRFRPLSFKKTPAWRSMHCLLILGMRIDGTST